MDENPINKFTSWMEINNFCVNKKICIDYKINSHYGVIAKDNLSEGEVLFQIPRKCLLTVENSILNKKVCLDYFNGSKWAKLILCILHEKFLGEESLWCKYLQVFPNFVNMELPMFWNDTKLKYLQKTGFLDILNNDLQSINKDFNEHALPFIKAHPELFERNIDLHAYKSVVAFVMAYSFTEPTNYNNDDSDEEVNSVDNTNPSMVPMADALNHISENNAALNYFPDKLVMMAIKDIRKGEEIFNTYGDLPNVMLLNMYGYTLSHEDNKDDVIEINLCDWEFFKNHQERLSMIKEYRDDLLLVVIDRSGFMNSLESAQLLNYLTMGAEDFKSIRSTWEGAKDDEDWDEISEQLEEYADKMDTEGQLCKLPKSWRQTIFELLKEVKNQKQNVINELTDNLSSDAKVNSPELFIHRLLDSHLKIMDNILQSLQL